MDRPQQSSSAWNILPKSSGLCNYGACVQYAIREHATAVVGFSDSIFQLLVVKSEVLGKDGKCYVLTFDEMSLKTELEYDRVRDTLDGLVELPEKRPTPCNEALVFMVVDGNLGEFFRHENHPWPPSLSLHGKLRLPNFKSKLLDLLPTSVSEDPDHFDVKVFDGPAIVHTLPRGGSSTFGEYSSNIFLPWTIRQLQDCKRIDVVWDVYYEESLKETTREKRGNGYGEECPQKRKCQ